MIDKTDLYPSNLTAAVWRKSSYSETGENCVEIADLAGGRLAVRDSKDTRLVPLRFTGAGWEAFRASVITGEI
ncbi:DUF397 domain-containing protein [Streptomyces sp. NPDC087440]|uniref:DUF397 domain-containing protein n=1 Tax=Streptomyces sp. NPDC087440 TaxID=3365790 RepID=UPI00382B3BFE